MNRSRILVPLVPLGVSFMSGEGRYVKVSKDRDMWNLKSGKSFRALKVNYDPVKVYVLDFLLPQEYFE